MTDEAAPTAERLAKTRVQMARLGVSGFVLPRTDQHGSEYLPASEERLAWLTGFTGSAGQAVVLADRAAVFADGRYTVQVAQEVDDRQFEICHLIDTPPHEWLQSALSEGARLGYDPMLTSRAQFKRLEKLCNERGADLVALDENPVDAAWQTRPEPPAAPAELLDVRFAGKSSVDKRNEIGQAVGEKGADWLAVTATDTIAWLLNVRGSDVPYNPLVLSHALLAADGRCRWFVDPRKIPEGFSHDNAVSMEPYEAFGPALDQLGGDKARVLVDPAVTHLGFINRLERSGAHIVEGDDPCILAKAVKNETEIAGSRSAHHRDGNAIVRLLHWLDSIPLDGSVDEMAVFDAIEVQRSKGDIWRGASFASIVGHGPNAALPHYRVSKESSRPLTRDTLLLIDSGAQYLDGTTDITRTIALGQPSDEMRQRFTLVLKGHIAIDTSVFPVGTTGSQLDTLARYPLWQAGLDFDHGTGHGIGSFLCVHEGPQRISKRGGDVALRPGMILSNEPGFYKAGEYGIRIENLVLVQKAETPEGADRDMLSFETLTWAPIDRRLIDFSLLSDEERDWIDRYHARVYRELSTDAGDALSWLEDACAPL